MPQKRCALTLLIFLSACAPATAQLKVSTPGMAYCTEGTTLTPVIGIAVDADFGGWQGLKHSDAFVSTLHAAGFKSAETYAYPLLDKASIKLEGDILNWKNAYGEESTNRVGKINLEVTDLSTREVLFTLRQDSARAVFQAPTFEQVYEQIVTEMSKRFCQLK